MSYSHEGIHMPAANGHQIEAFLNTAEVARAFRVAPVTVTRWEKAGKLSCIRTPGGHRRFREAEVRALLEDGPDKTDTAASA
jgi:excisionase family DNA binding protein